MYCTSSPFSYRDRNDVGVNDVSTENNKASSNHSFKNILTDSNSTTTICIEANLAYNSHSVKQTVGESPEDEIYEQVDSTPYNQ